MVAKTHDKPRRYTSFEVDHDDNGRIVAIWQVERDTDYPDACMEPSGFSAVVTEDGICINGDFGTSPSAETIHETTELLAELMATFNDAYEGGE